MTDYFYRIGTEGKAWGDEEKAAALAEFNAFKAEKEEGNTKLKGISTKYKLAARAFDSATALSSTESATRLHP